RRTDAPVASVCVNELNRSVHGFAFADDLQMQSCLAVAAGHLDPAGNDTAAVLHRADLRLQLLARAQKVFCLARGLAIGDLVQGDTDDPTNEHSDDQTENYDHAANYQEYLFRGHRPLTLAADVEVKDGEIVDERRVEEQAVQPVE